MEFYSRRRALKAYGTYLKQVFTNRDEGDLNLNSQLSWDSLDVANKQSNVDFLIAYLIDDPC